jgi:lipooligosaccharide transport system ATP-binding protein
MGVVIRAEKLVKKFEDLTAVDGISFAIEEAECFGFLGPNGAGKTTCIRMIQCVSPVTAGKLSVLGMDVGQHPREIKGQIGVVPQEDNLDPDLTVLMNMTTYARYFGMPKKAADEKSRELIAFMQLTEKIDEKIANISGGMKRRLIIARALLNDPRILILDEPTTGLDPQARHAIWDKLRDLKKRKVTVVITSHYMDEAQQLCDRLVIMDKGKILTEGTPKSLIAEKVGGEVVEVTPASPEVERFIIDKGWAVERVTDMLYVYSGNSKQVVDSLVSQFKLNSVVIRAATLEDVFLKLTGRGLRD